MLLSVAYPLATEGATMPENTQRDGFVIRSLDTNEEVDFVSCTYDEPVRERVERGMFMRIDLSRFYMFDTRRGANR